MSETMDFRRRVPVRHEVDVFVAGGGPAGVAAAVAAARQGAKVLLAEGAACFGGMGTAGLVPAFMQFGDGVNFCAGGIGREVLDRLRQAGGTGPQDRGDDYVRAAAAIKAEVLKRVYDDMVGESGAAFAFHTALIDVQPEGSRTTSKSPRGEATRARSKAGGGQRVAAAICAAKSGVFAVRAKVYVDATGDGDLCAWAGAGFEKGDATGLCMPGTLCSLWAGVDWEQVRSGGLGGGAARLKEALEAGVIEQYDLHLPGMWQVSDAIGGGNIGHTFAVDGTDERSLTAALVFGRRLVLQYERYYREYLKGFQNMELVATGSLLGLRESRRILGDYVLCLDDFKRRAVFEDEIGRYSYPVDIHPMKPGKEEFDRFHAEWTALRYGPGENYGIPYRILLPKGLDNVLVAGRCVSADRFLQGSIRTMPGCYLTGQAAGLAAAMAADKGVAPRALDVPDLQRRLKQTGAFLPNARA